MTSVGNIIPFESMSVFCCCIKGMLRSKVTDDSYICGLPSEHLQINLYEFLRIICTCIDFWKKNPYTEKNLYVYRYRFLGSKNSKMMKFSWNGTMLRTDVTLCSYVTALPYGVTLHVCTHFNSYISQIWVCFLKVNWNISKFVPSNFEKIVLKFYDR